MSAHVRVVLAVLYWFFVVFVFVGLRYADPGWAEGGIPLVIVCLPWSIPVLGAAWAVSFIPGLGRALTTEGGNFLLFAVLCAGANAVWIAGVLRVVRWFRESVQRPIVAAATAAVLVGAAQAIMPIVDRDALERGRPQNVPRDAVHVGGGIGWWQYCAYDSARHMDNCRIWNRGGLVLEDGEFVPYGGGAPATADELQIADRMATPQAVALRNGRFLIPRSREAEMTRFLDWMTGKRQTR